MPLSSCYSFILRKNPKSIFVLLPLLVAACLFCAGCTTGERRVSTDSSIKQPEKLLYTDGLGRKVTLPRRPERIISLAPDITETLYLLGAEDRLIGVTTLCTWPEAAKRKPKIGDLLNPNYEVILAAKPDLVIASTAGNVQSSVMKLSDLGLPVYVSSPRSVEAIFRSVEELGRVTDCRARATKLVSEMRERLNQVKLRISGLPPVRAFFITWFDPLLAPGKNTFQNGVLELAGIQSITSDIPQFYPRYSLEQVIMKNPDAILTIEHKGDPIPDLKKMPGWKNLRAVKQGKIYNLSEYLQHPSPLFVDGVEDLARQLHPERFK